MAERRMFTQKIIDSDAFLDMPLSTQALYFHLNMRADDDGFINNPKRIQRTIGASEDDLELLLAKRFVIGFQSGVLVIKHWRMHNTLRKDRYNPTQYQEELAMLDIKDNNAYTERLPKIPAVPALPETAPETVATTWQPHGNQLEPQYSIGKVSIDKYREGKGNTYDSDESEPPAPEKQSVSCQQIVDMYNSICKSFPSVRSLSESRKKAIKARLKTYTIEDFKTVFENAEASSFLKGRNERNWSANFDWMISDKNMAKILEGNYADKPKRFGRKENVPDWMENRDLDDDELHAIRQMMDEKPQKLTDEQAAEAERLRQQFQSWGNG